MKILMTGAAGFIGTRLCEVLAQQGHSLVALSRSPARSQKNFGVPIEIYRWEAPAKFLPTQAAFEGVDAVIHLAGESISGYWSDPKMKAIRESRVVGTRHLVQGMARLASRPKMLISASAIGYYGNQGDAILSEDSQPRTDFLSAVCHDWEEEATRAKELGLRVAQLRFGIVLGPGGGALSAMLLPFRLGLGGPMGSGRQWWSWVHREDVIGLIEMALAEGLEGPVNVTSPNPLPQREFAKVLGRVLGRPAFMPTPALVLKLMLSGFSAELLGSKRVMPERALQAGYKFRYPELEPGLREILQR